MKLPILLLSLCLLGVQSSPTKKMSDREAAGFIGPVKSVFVEFEMTDRNYGDRLQGRHCRDLTEVYDHNGRLIQRSVYPGNCGEDEIRETYNFAADGSRTTKSEEIRDKNSPPPPPAIAGHRNGSDDDSGPVRELFRYDASGRLAEIWTVRSKGIPIYKMVYEYDSMGREIESHSVDADGATSAHRVNGYEGNNKVPSTFSYTNGRGEVQERTTYSHYEFNSQGDWIKRKVKTEETLNRKQTLIETRKIEYYADKN